MNQKFADKFFPGQDVIGKRIKPGWSVDTTEPQMREIIGVVGNVKHASLRREETPEMYMAATSYRSERRDSSSAPPRANAASVTSAVRAELARTDANVPLTLARVFD